MTNERIDRIIENLKAFKDGKELVWIDPNGRQFSFPISENSILWTIGVMQPKPESRKPEERWIVVKQPHNNEICYGSEAMAKVFAEEFGGRIIHVREVVEEKPI